MEGRKEGMEGTELEEGRKERMEGRNRGMEERETGRVCCGGGNVMVLGR